MIVARGYLCKELTIEKEIELVVKLYQHNNLRIADIEKDIKNHKLVCDTGCKLIAYLGNDRILAISYDIENSTYGKVVEI